MLKETFTNKSEKLWKKWVLILILMEHAQRDAYKQYINASDCDSLNPYFNGTCSKSLTLGKSKKENREKS